MELIVFVVLLLLVAGLVLRDADAHVRVPLQEADEGPGDAVETEDRRSVVRQPVADIVPLVPQADRAEPVIEVMHSDGFLRTQTFEPVERARTLVATLRLLAVVIACGIGAGFLLLLVGRGIGVLIRRVSGA